MTIHPVTRSFIKGKIPKRNRTSNKTHGGKVLIVGGSKGMLGASILSALAATRSGAGYTYVMMNWKAADLLRHPDLLFSNLDLKILNTSSFDSFVIGPGLGKDAAAKKWLKLFIKRKFSPAVIDADALNLLSDIPAVLLPKNWILTPHEGELARMLHTTSSAIQKNPVKHILMAHKKWGCHILLKGATSYITDGKNIFSSDNGSPALAKAGTGDVLSGIIGGLLAQKLKPMDAALTGVFIHGLATGQWLKLGNDHLSFRPIDLIDQLPKTIKSLRF